VQPCLIDAVNTTLRNEIEDDSIPIANIVPGATRSKVSAVSRKPSCWGPACRRQKYVSKSLTERTTFTNARKPLIPFKKLSDSVSARHRIGPPIVR
jgi:hypothetical protein